MENPVEKRLISNLQFMENKMLYGKEWAKNGKIAFFSFPRFFPQPFSCGKIMKNTMNSLLFHKIPAVSIKFIPHRFFLCGTSDLAFFSTTLFGLLYGFSTHFSTGVGNCVENLFLGVEFFSQKRVLQDFKRECVDMWYGIFL